MKKLLVLVALLMGFAAIAQAQIVTPNIQNYPITWVKGATTDSSTISLPASAVPNATDPDTTAWIDMRNWPMWAPPTDSTALFKMYMHASGATASDTVALILQYSPDKTKIGAKTAICMSALSRCITIVGGEGSTYKGLGMGLSDPAMGVRYIRIIARVWDGSRGATEGIPYFSLTSVALVPKP